MSSRDKQEIVQNGIFGTLAGLAAGGIPGMITAGIASVAVATSQEKKDQELRDKEAERKRLEKEHRDNILNELQDIPYAVTFSMEDYKRSTFIPTYDTPNHGFGYSYEDISYLNNEFYNSKRLSKFHIQCDYNKNNIRVDHAITVLPQINPYVEIFITDYFSDIKGNGIVLDTNDFIKQYNIDKHNPNMRKYKINHKFYQGIGKYLGYTSKEFGKKPKVARRIPYEGHTFSYMYSVDNGKSFVVWW